MAQLNLSGPVCSVLMSPVAGPVALVTRAKDVVNFVSILQRGRETRTGALQVV